MAPIISILTTLFSTLLIARVNAGVDGVDGAGYVEGYTQPPPPAYIQPSVVTIPTYPANPVTLGTPTSTAGGQLTTHLTSTTHVTSAVTACPSPAVTISLVTSIYVSTVSYVTTITSVQGLPQTFCPPPAPSKICVTGAPVVTGGYTLTYAEVKPTAYLAAYVPDLDWETGSGNHLVDYVDFQFGGQYQAYAEFKCQFLAAGHPSYFVAYNTQNNIWTCLWYNTLIPASVLVAPPADAPYVSGAAFNALCGPQSYQTPPITDPYPTGTPTSSHDGVLTSSTPLYPTPPTYGLPGVPTSSHGGVPNTSPKPTTPAGYGPPPVPTSNPGGGNGGYPTTLQTTPKPPVYGNPIPTSLIPTVIPGYPLPSVPAPIQAPPPVGGGGGDVLGGLGGLGGLLGGGLLGGGLLGGLRRNA